MLTRLRLGLSHHLNRHKFKHGFNDTIYPICICRGDVESVNHFFLHNPEYYETLSDNIQSIDTTLLSKSESSLTRLLLYGDPKYNSNVNVFIFNTTTELTLSLGKFNGPLFNSYGLLYSRQVSVTFYIWLCRLLVLF